MMYIRTKDGRIIDTTKIVTGSKYMDFATNDESFRKIFKTEPLSKSENLDELCDEFVIHRKEHNYNFVWNEDRNIGLNYFCFLPEKYDVYGAVWVDGKGLIYVAKMDSEGKLVLI